MFERIAAAMKSQPSISPIKDQKTIDKQYRYWRIRIMYGILLGYATFYFVRKNFSMANPRIAEEFNFSNTEMGLILSVATIIYAISKFTSGVLSDRSNARYFMAIGLIASALMNVFVGFSSALLAFIIFWGFNNLFQGMGMPPCSRLLTLWYSRQESGRAWGIWNSSHQIGGAIIVILSGYLVDDYGWRYAFYVPAVIAVVVAFFIMNRLRDTPESLGLPPVNVYKGEITQEEEEELEQDLPQDTLKEIFVKYILKNRMVWIVSIANFFVYIVRIGMLDWAPKMLVESKGVDIQDAGYIVSTFEIVGMVGAFAAGWLSDSLFKGRRGPVSVLFMLLLIFSVIALIYIPEGHFWTLAIILSAIGFFVYGPQMLVAVAATDFATEKAAAAAVGLTGLFGYIGATVCGIGTGIIVDNYGWTGGIYFYVGAAIIGTLLFLITWNKRSPVLEHHHQKNKEK